jgi:hypothetical protein
MRRPAVALLASFFLTSLAVPAFAGPGSVVIKTDGDITATFGAQVRVIPVYEQNWDFGISETAFGKANPIVGGNALGRIFLNHLNEAGVVCCGYIRSEDRLYFNFAKGDLWDVYIALEFDDVLSSRTVDRAHLAQGDFDTFGLERLNASVKLPWIASRLHAGWDIYAVDSDTVLLVYADDDPGVWLKGGVGSIDWQLGYHKKDEVNRARIAPDVVAGAVVRNAVVNTSYDNDRDIYSARINFSPTKDIKLGLLYTYDHLAMRFLLPTGDPCRLLPGPFAVIGNPCPKVDSHHIGPVVTASLAGFKFTGQYVHQFGEAGNTGITNAAVTDINNANYDIDAHAFLVDLAYDLTPWAGFRLTPHVGVIYASGDDNPNDNRLAGYVGNVDGQRFTPIFGGENTILGDFNLVVGTNLYSFIPNLRGNQHAGLVTGGLLNNGRGDSPGLWLVGGGVTVAPLKNLVYRTNAYYLRYDERPCVNPAVVEVPVLTAPLPCREGPLAPGSPNSGFVNSKEIGVGWDNEVMVWLDKNMVVKGQFSFLFPGDAVRDITRITTRTAASPGGQAAEETAIRLALEFLWNF